MTDLFGAAGLEKDAPRPLADRLRPKLLAEVVGQDHLLAKDGTLGRMIEARRAVPPWTADDPARQPLQAIWGAGGRPKDEAHPSPAPPRQTDRSWPKFSVGWNPAPYARGSDGSARRRGPTARRYVSLSVSI